MADIFYSEDVMKLLENKHVVLFGDSSKFKKNLTIIISVNVGL